MKNILLLTLSMLLLAACDARVTPAAAPAPAQPDKVIEKTTTIVNPPAVTEKKVENNTTIINKDTKQKEN